MGSIGNCEVLRQSDNYGMCVGKRTKSLSVQLRTGSLGVLAQFGFVVEGEFEDGVCAFEIQFFGNAGAVGFDSALADG